MGDAIFLAAINAKWIHPSLALRLLKANLGELEKQCGIIEFALRQPLREKVDPILAARPRILGLSVSIWNHSATLELLRELHKVWDAQGSCGERPVIILGGPEVSHVPPESEIFYYADYCVAGEGEIAFRLLCEKIFAGGNENSVSNQPGCRTSPITFLEAQPVEVTKINSGYRLYTGEDLCKKLVYVEASRGCPFGCEFCLSTNTHVREFPLEQFFTEMDDLIDRGAGTFKFLDRTFNLNIERARRVMEYFLDKLKTAPLVVHFEMVPSRFPPELRETIARFPPGSLRLEIGIQTLNAEVSAHIGRPSNPGQELAALRYLREKTAAIIHADLIAGLPGEDMASFAAGFDALWAALSNRSVSRHSHIEIQLGILKLLPGAPLSRHTAAFGMRYNPSPPYELMESAAIPAGDFDRIKNFARFWELIVNRGLWSPPESWAGKDDIFEKFMTLSDSLLARFGRNWGIPKNELLEAVHAFC